MILWYYNLICQNDFFLNDFIFFFTEGLYFRRFRDYSKLNFNGDSQRLVPIEIFVILLIRVRFCIGIKVFERVCSIKIHVIHKIYRYMYFEHVVVKACCGAIRPIRFMLKFCVHSSDKNLWVKSSFSSIPNVASWVTASGR